MPRGGFRPGAGRPKEGGKAPAKKRPVAESAAASDDPVAFLVRLMNDVSEDVRVRADAAKALLPYKHAKKGEGGKKDARDDAAKKVAGGGKFAPAQGPRLVVNNSR